MGMAAPWLLLFGLIASSLLATLYLALTLATRAPVEEIAARRNRPRATRRVGVILEDPTGHARSVGLLTLGAYLLSVVAAIDWLTQLRGKPGPGWSEYLVGVAGTSLVLWLICVALPMSVAAHAGPRLIYSRSLLIRIIDVVMSPLKSVAGFIDEVVRRLAGAEREAVEHQLEKEILSVIEEGEAAGAIDEQEREMIEAVVGFRDRTVAQIMTPRTQIEAMAFTSELGQITKLIRRVGHSRIPVYEGTLDHIVGIFYVKDLMHWLGGDAVRGGKPFDLREILRPPLFVPETKTVNDLMRDLMSKKVHIAVVLDEYGGTSGLVTIEDIVEEVFGDIKDEYESPAPELPDAVVRLEERTAELDAAARIIDVNGMIEPLGVQIPVSDDYDTVGGFVTTTLGRIPAQGEQFRHDQMVLTVIEAKPTKVVKVNLKVAPPQEAGEASAPGESASDPSLEARGSGREDN